MRECFDINTDNYVSETEVRFQPNRLRNNEEKKPRFDRDILKQNKTFYEKPIKIVDEQPGRYQGSLTKAAESFGETKKNGIRL